MIPCPRGENKQVCFTFRKNLRNLRLHAPSRPPGARSGFAAVAVSIFINSFRRRQMWKTGHFPRRTSIIIVEKPVETVDKEAFSVLCDRLRGLSRFPSFLARAVFFRHARRRKRRKRRLNARKPPLFGTAFFTVRRLQYPGIFVLRSLSSAALNSSGGGAVKVISSPVLGWMSRSSPAWSACPTTPSLFFAWP